MSLNFSEAYAHLTTHIVPGPQSFSYFVPVLLLPIALLIPRSVLSRWQSAAVFLPVMLAFTVHAWMAMGGVDVISVDVLLWGVYFLGLRDVQASFRYAQVGGGVGKVVEGKGVGEEGRQRLLLTPYPARFWRRVPWVGTLLVSLRMHNWLIGDPVHDARQPPVPPSTSRLRFARTAVLSVVRGYLVLDVTRAYIAHDAYFTDSSIPISSPLPFSTHSDLNLNPPRLLRTTIIAAQAWATISQFTYLPVLLPLALNALGFIPDAWSPHTWAPLYGHPSTILLHGVRGFWSSYWHQAMRIMTSAPGYALADTMGLRKGGWGRYALILVVTFGLSGVVHMGLIPPEPRYCPPGEGAGALRLRMAAFFWLQPVAILAEVGVGKLVVHAYGDGFEKTKVGLACRVCGHALFFIAWSVVCLPLLGEVGRQIGYWRIWPLPVSVWRGVRGEGWWNWT